MENLTLYDVVDVISKNYPSRLIVLFMLAGIKLPVPQIVCDRRTNEDQVKGNQKGQAGNIQHAIGCRVGNYDDSDRNQHVPIADPVTEEVSNFLQLWRERYSQNKAQQ